MVFKTLIPTFVAGFLLYCGLLEHIFIKIKVLSFEESWNDPLEESSIADRSVNNGYGDPYQFGLSS